MEKNLEIKIADRDGTFIYALGPSGTNSFQAHVQSSGPDALTMEERQAVARLFAASPRMAKALQWAARVLAELPMEEQGPRMLSLRSEIVATIQEATPEYYGTKAKGE